MVVSHGGERVKLNVGGKIFETNASTIQSSCPDSLLAALSTPTSHDSNPIFIDRRFLPSFSIFSVLVDSQLIPPAFSPSKSYSMRLCITASNHSFDWRCYRRRC
ncbi:unnamed protein product [Arabidopsis halleri]